MTKKLKHRLIIEVTFSREVIEKDAYRLIRGSLDTSQLNQKIERISPLEPPKVRKFEIKRWSKIIPYVLKGEIT